MNKCSYRVQVWRDDHWMTLWRGFSFGYATYLRKWYEQQFSSNFRIAIP